MINIYTVDSAGLFTGLRILGDFDALPTGTLTPPPATTPPEVAQWQGSAWVVLATAPPTPPPPDPAIALAAKRTAAIIKIDADADKIYGDVVGNKGEEYRSAEADAKAFVTAEYLGVAGSGVTSWAAAKGWTSAQAADDVLAQAGAWRGAQASVRAQRLGKKEAVKAAVDSAAIDVLMGQWAGFVVVIRAQLGLS